MARLPIPGQDDGTWGDILNDYLSVEHNADGTLKRAAGYDAHVSDLAKHREINDSGTSSTEIWSANKVSSELAGKANTSHEHTASQITNFSDATDTRINLQKATASGLATLGSDSKIPTSQLPALAITNTSVISSQSAMLALTAEVGDVAVRTDQSKSYILTAEPASTLGNWQEILAPTGTVLSVNSQTGAVTLLTTDITEGSNLYYTDDRVDARITAQKAAANGLATLGSDSKIPSEQLPALAITSTSVVSSQSAQLALTAQAGDVAVRSDLNKSYIHNGGTSGTMADWQELLTPTDAVTSVAGRTGIIVLAKADVGLGNVDNTSDAAKPISTATQTALDLKADKSAIAVGGAFSGASTGQILLSDGTKFATQSGLTYTSSTLSVPGTMHADTVQSSTDYVVANALAGDIGYSSSTKSWHSADAIGDGTLRKTVAVNNADSSSIASTTSESDFSITLSFPANSLTVGRVIKIYRRFIYSTTGTPTITLKGYLGSNTYYNTGAITLGNNSSNKWAIVDGYISIDSTGSSGVGRATGTVKFIDATIQEVPFDGTFTIDTTGIMALKSSATWSASSASNTIKMTHSITEA